MMFAPHTNMYMIVSTALPSLPCECVVTLQLDNSVLDRTLLDQVTTQYGMNNETEITKSWDVMQSEVCAEDLAM